MQRNTCLTWKKGQMENVIGLFAADGVVESPLYGVQSADLFYKMLAEDTGTSKLKFDGLFFEKNSNRISLLFEYEWELKNGTTITFKVVDIIYLNENHKIEKLVIIYDTVDTRAALNEQTLN